MRRRQFDRFMEKWDTEFREWREENRRWWEESERRLEQWREEHQRWWGQDDEWRERNARFWAGRDEATQRWREENRRRWEKWDAWAQRWRDEAERQHQDGRSEIGALRADQKGRFDAIDAVIENDKRMTREILVQMREDRQLMRDMRHGIQTTTEGLLRVLDELRRGDGPSAAGA